LDALADISKDAKWCLIVPGNPRSKCWGVAASDAHTEYRKQLQRAMSAKADAPLLRGVSVEAVFYRSNRQRMDVDNMLKFVLDAALGIFWIDDSQVLRIAGRVEFDAANPRVEMAIGEQVTSMPRGDEVLIERRCEGCSGVFFRATYPSTPNAGRFCSKACMKRPILRCANENCDADFTPNSLAQRYCTKRCASSAIQTRQKIATAAALRARPLPNCRGCGAKLRRRNSYLCTACWLHRGVGDDVRYATSFGLAAIEEGTNPVVACKCGCGGSLDLFDARGRPRRYLTGHSRRSVG